MKRMNQIARKCARSRGKLSGAARATRIVNASKRLMLVQLQAMDNVPVGPGCAVLNSLGDRFTATLDQC
jgi:hypothetical protein